MGKIKLVLEREGQRQEYEFDTGMSGLMKAAGKIRSFMSDGWQLVDCSGDDPRMVGYIKDQIDAYAVDPKKYQVPIKRTFSVTKDVTGATAKQVAGAARKAIRSKLAGPFRRKKQACSRCGRVKDVEKTDLPNYPFLCKVCRKHRARHGGFNEV